MRRSYTGWLIDFFKGKITEGRFVTGSHLHKEIAWFPFSNMLQRDLSKLKMLWNTHRIRKSHEDVIGGIPNQLFYIPEYFGFQNCGLEVTEEDISNIDGVENVIERRYSVADTTDEELVGYFHNILQKEQLLWPPESWSDAVKLFDTLMEYN